MNSPNGHAVRLQGIRKSYGSKLAVDDFDLEVPRATICGLLGPNGAGKTTTIRILLDIIGADRGSVEVLGGRLTPEVRDRIGYLPEERGLYPKMRVLEHLVFLGAIKGADRQETEARAVAWLDRLELGAWADKRVQDLSRGMQQKVQFIGTVLHEPELLVLDEPFSGLDPLNVDLLKQIVLEERDRGATVLFSTHNMDQAERICERVVMIRQASKVLDGTLKEIKRDAWQEGQRRVLFAGDGDLSFLDDRSLVAGVQDNGTHLAVALADGVEPQELLQRAIRADVVVSRFEVSEPSLHEIFVARARG
ncbi:MAG: ATP-binding cassette domain-containing protein [Gemmatimonadetes bacterium]|uniref:ATP-binding cassette domain-containing protein n=1 Tax=Candidatus Kutchimonas denitrificans TaxID=3056748 RepID=A0AAE4Z8N9_9BACT|nr:ATP-binding cassette domain-containing protein [Gemmatimonadota bacterium]NIR75319.1 ATP-binding cassette domain-containing protein [Candidatus Kutchimonas denitrificans]NIS02145.1 ATP-binding cassette domain-containing protein [Gemmatimonadota bacterium]NIT67970.1 ATP-binding cassette domain-containing protein [Gemmatimonadota bacterium]NIU53964.1 ATP-binding cassette domain-containing protein [Gemmatimonadota bacterium]